MYKRQVLHGTDTMSYTASALSFLLENLAKPVVFTGSQIPVSYTHLTNRRSETNVIRFNNRIFTAAANYLNGVYKPVSYTHLDVYKRQTIHFLKDGLKMWRMLLWVL